MPKKTIVTCSGGLDSVGLLWKLLHETDEEILVQHIRIKCFWKHWESEEQAFLKCVEYIKANSRPFTVLPMMEYKSNGIAPYRPLGAFCGTLAAIQNDADRVVRATVKVDVESRNRTATWTNLYDVMIKIIETLTKDNDIAYERPVTDLDKRDWFTLMPEELTDMVTTCWHPLLEGDQWSDCGECYSCLRFAEGKAGTPPTHGDSWEREVVQYTRPLNIRRLYGKPTVLYFIDSSQENIAYLWHLLTETNMNVVVQSIEVTDSINDAPDISRIMEYLTDNAREFITLPVMQFVLPGVLDDRTKELAKIFCAGNLTRVYRTYISDVGITFPSDLSVKNDCKGIINSYYFGKNITITDTENKQYHLPQELDVIINEDIKHE